MEVKNPFPKIIHLHKQRDKNFRSGIAAFTVLFIAVAAAIIALGLITRTDRALATGKNIKRYMQTTYLAESGLTHAKTLLMYPQNIDIAATGYWQGDSGLRIEDTDTEDAGVEATGSDKYDLTITQVDSLTYDITSYAYCLDGTEKTARYCLQARLHLDPYITYWQTLQMALPAEVTINGDLYCDDDMELFGSVDGDVYAKRTITNSGTITGNEYASTTSTPVLLPGLLKEDFASTYNIDGSSYSVQQITPGIEPNLVLTTSPGNPAGIYYCDGSLALDGTCSITGMLVVRDDLSLTNNCSLTLTAVKNFPAAIVGNNIQLQNVGVQLTATGFIQVDNHIDLFNNLGASINVTGALYVLGDGIINTTGGSVIVTASPAYAVLQTWPALDTPNMWTPAGDALYRSITHVPSPYD